MNNFILKRTNSNNPDFKALIILLDKDLDEINGDLQLAYYGLNNIEFIETVVIAYANEQAVGCGCFKRFDNNTAEVKRMFVKHGHRNNGIAGAILDELEKWMKEAGYTYSVLETGKRHAEALHLYNKKGYVITENYDPYIGMEQSVCMKKRLTSVPS